MEILSEPSVKPTDEKLFFALIKAAFSQRRKTLANALSSSGKFGSKEKIKDYNRITVGSMAEMQALITSVEDILEV